MSILRDTVRSSQNQYISLARALGERKNRQKNRLFRFDGIKLFCESLKKNVNLRFVLLSESKLDLVMERAYELYNIEENDISCPLIPVEDSLFERISDENAPEGVICVGEYMEGIHREGELGDIDAKENILLLEAVRDPQNVGAILRAAKAFGVDRVVMSRDCADIYSPKTVRASMGALFGIKLDRVYDIASAIRKLSSSGRRVFGAALHKESYELGSFELSQGDCVLVGNEGHGLTDEALGACFGSVFIPMSEGVESLNAATASAVLMWEFFGKKSLKGEGC